MENAKKMSASIIHEALQFQYPSINKIPMDTQNTDLEGCEKWS